MGITGAAIASTLAEIAAVLFFLAYVLRDQLHRRYELFVFRGPDKSLQLTLF